jgi:choline dehydrogenase
MIYMRGQQSDYDHWASLGNPGWAWEDVLPVFKASEDYFGGSDEWHGSGGELRVEEPRVRWEILDAWREAAAECGIPKVAEFNRGDNFGSAYFHVNQRSGRRWSATRAWLRKALGRRNLTVATNAHASRIRFDTADGRCRATGVDYTVLGQGQQTAIATKSVILTAGAIGSPHLLQCSGIGPSGLLRERGVPVIRDTPGVGENLHDHLQIRTVYRVSDTVTLNDRARTLWGKAAMALEYALFRRGPFTMPPSQLGAFARSDPMRKSCNIEWHVQPLSLDKFGEPLHLFPAITPSVCNLQPTSRGWVRLRSPDTREAPEIQLNYLSTEEDRCVARDSLRFTRRIMASPALARFKPQESLPGPSVDSDEALVKAAGDLGTTIFHPVSTCRMGPGGDAVVDARLRVHGIEGLRVIDASVMPRITSGNTNAPVYMIAEKGARMVLEDCR